MRFFPFFNTYFPFSNIKKKLTDRSPCIFEYLIFLGMQTAANQNDLIIKEIRIAKEEIGNVMVKVENARDEVDTVRVEVKNVKVEVEEFRNQGSAGNNNFL